MYIRIGSRTEPFGCGSSGGASRRVRNDVAGVAGLVDAVAFLGEVVAPVVFEVAVAAKRAEPEDAASSKMRPTTDAASSTTLAINHLLAGTGPAAASRRSSSVAGRMSAGVRGVGVAS